MNRLAPQKIRRLSFILDVTGVLIAVYGVMKEEHTGLMVTGLVILIVSMIFYGLFYRCPHCGAYLDRSTGPFCPKCGKEVNEVR